MNASPSSASNAGTRRRPILGGHARLIVLGFAALLVVLALAACTTPDSSGAPGSPVASAVASAASPAPSATPQPTATPVPVPLAAASPTDPMSFLAWLFTPLFQLMFMILIGIYNVTGNIGIAIVVLTILIRAVQIPLFRTQTVSTRRMQLIQPEIKELQKQYKGDRQRLGQAQMELYKERGVNPTAGCLPMLLSMFLLIPMYTVIRDGLSNYDPTAMLTVFGTQIVPLTCSAVDKAHACVDTQVLGFDVAQPQILFHVAGFPIGGLAIVAAVLQLIQSRMVLPPAQTTSSDDPTAGTQRTMMYILPLFMLLWSSAPAGLFIYWIVSTIFSIVQQYLIVGWGSMFPLFGWNPAFATGHTPRFPVEVPRLPISGRSVAESRRKPEDRAASAAATVRPRPQRGRQGRRGRRR